LSICRFRSSSRSRRLRSNVAVLPKHQGWNVGNCRIIQVICHKNVNVGTGRDDDHSCTQPSRCRPSKNTYPSLCAGAKYCCVHRRGSDLVARICVGASDGSVPCGVPVVVMPRPAAAVAVHRCCLDVRYQPRELMQLPDRVVVVVDLGGWTTVPLVPICAHDAAGFIVLCLASNASMCRQMSCW
jgi:hypothetical protein